MTSCQRVFKLFRHWSSSFKSGQWQTSCSGRSKAANPGQTTELWSACGANFHLWQGEEKKWCKIIFIPQYGTFFFSFKPTPTTACTVNNSTVGGPHSAGRYSWLNLCQNRLWISWDYRTIFSRQEVVTCTTVNTSTEGSLFFAWMETNLQLTGWAGQLTVHRFDA